MTFQKQLTGIVIFVALAASAIAAPNEVAKLNNQAIKAFEYGDYREAIRAYDSAIAITPKEASLYYNRGLAEFALQSYARATGDFEKAVRLDPSRAEFFNARGGAYAVKGWFDIALSDFQKALALDPHNAEAIENEKMAKEATADIAAAADKVDMAAKVALWGAKWFAKRWFFKKLGL